MGMKKTFTAFILLAFLANNAEPSDEALIPAGEFLMGTDQGTPAERPIHRTTKPLIPVSTEVPPHPVTVARRPASAGMKHKPIAKVSTGDCPAKRNGKRLGADRQRIQVLRDHRKRHAPVCRLKPELLP